MYLSRALERFFVRCSENFKAVALLGPRQVGKTTMLKRLADEEYERTGRRRTYVTLDDVDDRALAKSDPKLFLQVYKPPVLIDEIQKAPELLSQLKVHLDQTDEMGSVWLTCSQPLHLKRSLGDESLAGRVAVLDMMGLSQAETAQAATVPFDASPSYFAERARGVEPVSMPDFYRMLWKGSLPGIRLKDDEFWRTSYASYVST